VSASKPSRRVSRKEERNEGDNSSCMFSSAPPSAKAAQQTGMTRVSRRSSLRTRAPIAVRALRSGPRR
jgi:hypothetical protein